MNREAALYKLENEIFSFYQKEITMKKVKSRATELVDANGIPLAII
nr:hypothetical protein [uncultured Glaciecola sp.]